MEYRYWDTCCFLKWLKKEPEYEKCKGVIERAEAGELQLITSAMTIAEVIYLRPEEKIDRKKSEEICRFFENEYIVPVNVDRYLAEFARNLLWDYKVLRSKDALHVASAIKAKVPIFDTFDDYLISLNGSIGNPPLIIGKPNIHFQEELSFGKRPEEDEEKSSEDAKEEK